MNIEVYRASTVVASLPLEFGTFSKALMGNHNLVFSFSSTSEVDVRVGDRLTYKGEAMIVNKTPEVQRDHQLEYSITFEGLRHSLARYFLKDEGAFTFDYTADLETYMFMFLESINAHDEGWTLGDIEEVEPFSVSFDKVDHLSALSMIAEGAQCEWQIKQKVISVKKTIGVTRDYPLSYGRENGLYSIKRVSLENSRIITRAYAVGGAQNLPLGYPHKQLSLDDYVEDATAVALYGIREGIYEDDTIYPQRTGTVTGVSQINEGTFALADTSIDFNIDGQRIDGTEAYIVFKSGMLNGQQFKILSYNHTNKTIRYEANKDSNGGLLPSGASIAEVGDTYILIGIRMPSIYVDDVLSQLIAKRLEYLNSNKVPRVVYEAPLDPLDLKRNGVVIDEGDILPFTDDKIGLDDELRVTSVSYPATFPDILTTGMVFTAEIGQEVTYTRIQKIEKDIKENRDVITQVGSSASENNRRNAVALQEFKSMVFDPDGNMQDPLLEAIAGVFGTTSMYYDLQGVSISVNAGGNANSLTLTAGKLVHRVYKIPSGGYIWDLLPFSVSGLDPLKAYYLAAKVSRTALTGEWVLTEEQMQTEGVGGDYWYFNFGILSSVIDGARSFRPTKLYTVISGGNIETNTITAYMIDVQRLFAQYIEAENFWLKIGKIGIFDVINDQIRTKNWTDGSNSGVRFTENGLLSRNANEIIYAASTGRDWRGSIIGRSNHPQPSTQQTLGTYVRAAIVGINDGDMGGDQLSQTNNTYGHWGGMFSSLKVLGGVELPIRRLSGSGIATLTRNDYTVLVSGTHTYVNFPWIPNHGQIIRIRNVRSVAVTIGGNGINFLLSANNTTNEHTLGSGKTIEFQFTKAMFETAYWVELSFTT